MVLEIPGGLFGQGDVRETPTTSFTAAEAVPIGCILPYLKSFTSVPAMPTGFLECDGSVINDADSPMNGETLPDLNGGEFLRGNSTSGGTGGSTSTGSGTNHTHGLGAGYAEITIRDTDEEIYQQRVASSAWTPTHKTDFNLNTETSGVSNSTATDLGGSTDGESSHTHTNNVKYYAVVWIMRIK